MPGWTSWQLKNKRPRGNGALNPVMVHLKYLVDDTDVSMLFERTSCGRDYPCFFSPGNYSTHTGGIWTRRGSNPHLHHDRETCSHLHHGPDFRVYGLEMGCLREINSKQSRKPKTELSRVALIAVLDPASCCSALPFLLPRS